MKRPGPEEAATAERGRLAPDAEAAAVRAAVRAVRSGDREAFARLVTLYQRRLFGLALVMVRDPAAAEEITQDTFVNAFTHLDFYDPHRPFYPWLATIAHRRAQNWLRHRARRATRESDPLPPEPGEPSPEPGPLEELLADESGQRLWQMVSALPSGERTAVLLYYRQEMNVNEIARVLGVSSGTVKTLLFRARRRLRQAVESPGAIPNGEEHRT